MEYRLELYPEKSFSEEPESVEFASDFEMMPDRSTEKADSYEELILTPSLHDGASECADLTLEAESIAKAEEITFKGEEESEARIKEAMIAYDKAMDQAAGI